MTDLRLIACSIVFAAVLITIALCAIVDRLHDILKELENNGGYED